MKIQRLDKKKVDEQPLPQMIREYILHDRGNSIFLGDSFANLPSPVGEGQTIKNLFKFNEDDDEDKRKLNKDKEKEKNEIKIEGKSEKKSPPKKQPSDIQFKIDTQEIREIDKIVFAPSAVKTTSKADEIIPDNDPYSDLLQTKLNVNQSYQEEDSYINPSNVSKVNQSYDDLEQQISILDPPQDPYLQGKQPKQKKSRKILVNQYENINDSNILQDVNQS